MLEQGYRGGGSLDCMLQFTRHEIELLRPRRVVDFGAGRGKLGSLCREALGDGVHLTAVEGCTKTIQILQQNGIYQTIDHALIQEWVRTNSAPFDLAIFGDVIEHLTRREAFQVLNRTLTFASNIIINVPLRNLVQDPHEENPLEEHKAYFTEQCFDKRYILREKHIVTPDPGWVQMNAWIVGRRHIRLKSALKNMVLKHFGRKGKRLLEWCGYDGLFPSGYQWDGQGIPKTVHADET